MTTLLAPLPPDTQSYEVLFMLTPSRAVDLYLGDLGRRSRSKSGRTASSYARILDKFTDSLRRKGDIDVSDITSDDCRAFLDRYTRRAAGTQANVYSILNSFLDWLDTDQRRIKRNPMDFVPQPRRIRAEHLDVTTVSTTDVPKLIAACETDAERICIAILVYLGPRRNAVALLRFSDYERNATFDEDGQVVAAHPMMRFQEKGSKTIWKPVPDELAEIIDAAIARGVYDNPTSTWGTAEPDPYLVPSEGGLVRQGDRDDRVIWRLVKKVGDRAGINIHVHALRSAFALHYLQTHPNDLTGLQELLGHASIETTAIYLRKLDKAKAMEPVRTLSWGPDLSVELLQRAAPTVVTHD